MNYVDRRYSTVETKNQKLVTLIALAEQVSSA